MRHLIPLRRHPLPVFLYRNQHLIHLIFHTSFVPHSDSYSPSHRIDPYGYRSSTPKYSAIIFRTPGAATFDPSPPPSTTTVTEISGMSAGANAVSQA